MGYCFMTTQKIKSMGSLTSKYIHNYRKADIPNADPELYKYNDSLYNTKDEFGDKMNYYDAWKERMQDIPSYRSNAVLAIEVVMTFSREDNIDIEEWKRQNLQWLEKTFNIAPDGKSNVLDVIYHADEPGNVHCHAIIVPVDEKGNLNASHFLDGAKKLREMQTDYAKDMEKFGLERGLENGRARHQDIKKYYADLNNTLKNVPEPKINETATDYRDRVLEELETLQAAAKRERDKEKQRMERELAERRIYQDTKVREEWKKLELEKGKAEEELKTKYQSLIQQIGEKKDELLYLNTQVDLLKNEKLELMEEIKDIEKESDSIENKIKFFDQFQKQFTLLSNQDPESASELKDYLSYMAELREEKER